MPERLILTSTDLSRSEIRHFKQHVLTARTIWYRDQHWSIRVPHFRISRGGGEMFYRFELTKLPE